MSEITHNALFKLDHLGLIKVSGIKPETFLQGQLTADLNMVTPTQMRLAAFCNLQGRVLALLSVVQWQGLQLVLPKALIESVKKHLSKVALVSRVTLEAPVGISIYGFYCANKTEMTPFNLSLPEALYAQITTNETCIYCIAKQFYLILVADDQKASLEAPFLKQNQIYDAALWHKLQLQRMHFEIYPNTQAQFLPHRIGLHTSGYMSFDKGCYRGQEIIARTQYRAKLKHGLALFLVDDVSLTPGLKIFSPTKEKSELGELIDVVPYLNNQLLVLVSILFEHPQEVIFEGHDSPMVLNNAPDFSLNNRVYAT